MCIIVELRSLRIISKEFSNENEGPLKEEGESLHTFLSQPGFRLHQTDESLARRLDQFCLTCILLDEVQSKRNLEVFDWRLLRHEAPEPGHFAAYWTLGKGFRNVLKYAKAFKEGSGLEGGMEMSEDNETSGTGGCGSN